MSDGRTLPMVSHKTDLEVLLAHDGRPETADSVVDALRFDVTLMWNSYLERSHYRCLIKDKLTTLM